MEFHHIPSHSIQSGFNGLDCFGHVYPPSTGTWLNRPAVRAICGVFITALASGAKKDWLVAHRFYQATWWQHESKPNTLTPDFHSTHVAMTEIGFEARCTWLVFLFIPGNALIWTKTGLFFTTFFVDASGFHMFPPPSVLRIPSDSFGQAFSDSQQTVRNASQVAAGAMMSQLSGPGVKQVRQVRQLHIDKDLLTMFVKQYEKNIAGWFIQPIYIHLW